MKHNKERRLTHHLDALMRRKVDLDVLISKEMRRSLPCSITLQHLKKLKLRVKDRIGEMQHLLDPGNTAKSTH